MSEELKTREIEILRLMAEEQTNREIADRLYLGVETVRWYAKQIYSKLDVSGREEAARKAASLGLLDKIQLIGAPHQLTKHNLPTQLTSFIGREGQIAEIIELVHETRLLTLTGPGGTGKTRLSLKVAERLLDDFEDGVYFVDLGLISDSIMVANAIAHTLSITQSGNQPILETLKRAIGQRKMLLLLDNYEHVIEAAPVVSELLASALHIKIIVTSRVPLRIAGEQVYPVPSMALARNKDSEPPESVMLFVQRSQAVKPHFRIAEANEAIIFEICDKLDGIPLAIELAAALSRFLTPEAILARMENRFQSLKGGSRDAPARQQTLRNTIDWSYNLLDEGEKILFARLAVFRGGRSLEAIETICGENLPIDVFDGLGALVDKSMIRQVEGFNGEPRFVMLETIQKYAWERLEENGEAETLRRRHAQYFADLTAYAQPFLRKAGQEYWFPRLTVEQDNIRAALRWSLFGGDVEIGLQLVDTLQEFWFYEGYHIEGQRWAEQALEHLSDVDPLRQVGVLETAGVLFSVRQEFQHGIPLLKQALATARELGNIHKTAWLLVYLAQITYDASKHTQQDYEAATKLCEEGLTIFRELNDKVGLAQGLNILGNLHRVQGSYHLARTAYEECLPICSETGERRREAMLLANLSMVAVGLQRYKEARQLAYNALRLSWEIKFNYMTVLMLGAPSPTNLAVMGRPESAACLVGASAALQDKMNIRQQPNDLLDVERTEANVRQQLGEAAFKTAYEAGSRMSLEQAVEFALSELNNI